MQETRLLKRRLFQRRSAMCLKNDLEEEKEQSQLSTAWKNQLTTALVDLAKSESTKNELLQTLKAHQQRIDCLQTELAQSREHAINMQLQLRVITSRWDDQSAMWDVTTSRLEDVQTRNGALNMELFVAQSRILELESDNDELHQHSHQIEQLQNEIVSMRDLVADLESKLAAKTADYNRVERALAQAMKYVKSMAGTSKSEPRTDASMDSISPNSDLAMLF